MVSANASKELQNVLPKCNPFRLYISYDIYWSDPILLPSIACGGRVGVRGFSRCTLTSQSLTKSFIECAAFAAFAACSACCAYSVAILAIKPVLPLPKLLPNLPICILNLRNLQNLANFRQLVPSKRPSKPTFANADFAVCESKAVSKCPPPVYQSTD